MEKVTKSINSINGPVSLRILAKDQTKFILFGDEHYSKGGECEGSAIRMNKTFTNVVGEADATSIDIDAAIHLLLLYNNALKITTDTYLETIATRARAAHMATRESKDWLESIRKLSMPCTHNRNTCPYAPYSRIHHADIRQARYAKTDIMAWIALAEIDTPIELAQFTEIVGIVIDRINLIWDAYTTPKGFRNIYLVQDEIRKMTDGRLKHEVLAVIDGMIKYSTKVRDNVLMHSAAWQNIKLLRSLAGKQIAQTNMKYLRDSFNTHAADIIDSGVVVNLIIALEDARDEKRTAINAVTVSYVNYIRSEFIKFGSLFMDLYLVSRSLYFKSDMKIVYAGDAHIDTYHHLLLAHGFKDELIINPNIYVDDDYERPDTVRCMSDPRISNYFDFAEMRRYLTESGDLKTAEYRLTNLAKR